MAEEIKNKPKMEKEKRDEERLRILEFFGLRKTGEQVKPSTEKKKKK